MIEIPTRPGFFLLENGIPNIRACIGIAFLYEETALKVKRSSAKLILGLELKGPVFFVLWSEPSKISGKEAYFKFWFLNEEDYALALITVDL